MSDTPRTDANRKGKFLDNVVPVEFARTLERENNQLRARLTGAMKALARLGVAVDENALGAEELQLRADLKQCADALNVVHPCPYCGFSRGHDVGCLVGQALSLPSVQAALKEAKA